MPYASSHYSIPVVTRRDTFTSTSGKTMYESDITNKNYRMTSGSANLGLEAAYIYNFFPSSGISFYTGFGVGANFSIVSRSQVFYYKSTERRNDYEKWWQTNSYPTTITPLSSSDNFAHEVFKGKGNYGFSAYLPLGVDIHLGGNIDFLKITHLLYEMRPVIGTHFGALNRFNSGSLHHNFGLKYVLK